MPALNSYILLSKVSDQFHNDINTALQTLNISWWNPNPNPIHLTLGQCMGTKADSPQLIKNRNDLFERNISAILNRHANNSTLLKPTDIEITESGWVILKYQTVNVDSQATQTESTNIEKIHKEFEDLVAKNEKQFNIVPDKHGKNFMPHVSLGIIKSQDGKPTAQEILTARQDLAKNKVAILAILNQMRTLNLYDFEFIYNNINGGHKVLCEKNLVRRNFGIHLLTKSTQSINVQFRFAHDAGRFKAFMENLIGAQAKINKIGNHYLIELSHQDYSNAVGLVEGCLPIKLIDSQPAAVPNKPPHINHLAPNNHRLFTIKTMPPKNNDFASFGVNDFVLCPITQSYIMSFSRKQDALNFSQTIFQEMKIASSSLFHGKHQPKHVKYDTLTNKYTLAFDHDQHQRLLNKFSQQRHVVQGIH